MPEKQPWGILLNCIVLIIGGFFALIGAIWTGLAGDYIGTLIPYAGMLTGIAVMLLFVAIIEFLLCYGLWIRHIIAWWILVIVGFLGILSAVWSMLSGNYMGWISLGITIALLAALLHKDTISAVNPGIDWKGWALEVE